MVLNQRIISTIVFISLILKVCETFEYCTDHSASSLTVYYLYCEYRCCGYIYNIYCCENFSGAIAGAVVGFIFFLGMIIGIIVCLVKKKGHHRAATSPAGGGPHIIHHSVAFDHVCVE